MSLVHLNRRMFLAASAAAAAMPAFVGEAEAAIDINEWHDQNEATHLSNRTTAYNNKYRELSLAMHGDPASPHYTAVMFKGAAPPGETQQFNSLSWDQLKAKFVSFANATPKWAPYIVTATGPRATAKFSAVFVQSTLPTLLWADMTPDDLAQKNAGGKKSNLIPLALDAYGTADDPRYCAIWVPNGVLDFDIHQWCVEAIDEEVATVQQRFNAMTTVGGRSQYLAITPSGRYLHGFIDGNVGAWYSRGDMTTQGYESALTEMKGKGLVPVRVSAKPVNGAMRYAAIFTNAGGSEKRTAHHEGLDGISGGVSGIDDTVLGYMKWHGIRGAALAITLGTSLVYARGYTLAESGYPATKPATLFRLASCSKTFAAVAAWKLMQDDPSFTLDTTVQQVMNLTPFSGGVGAGFDKVRVRDLLEMTSGIDPSLVFASPEAAAAANHSLPAKPNDLARFCSGFDCVKPQDTTNVTYNNMGYTLLSQVIATKAGTMTFEDALTKLVLQPMSMKTTREAKSLLADQKIDEAHYHFLGSNKNVRVSNAPLAPYHYGGMDFEIYDGAGGLSSSVLDVARLMAMFSAGDTACLTKATMNAMLQAAANATDTYTGPDAHGYHGFDGVDDKTFPGSKIATKGGWVEGAQSYLSFAPGSLGVTMLINTNEREDGGGQWLNPIVDFAATYNWGSTDLFTQKLGLPALPSAVGMKKVFKMPPKYHPSLINQQQRNTLQMMRRRRRR